MDASANEESLIEPARLELVASAARLLVTNPFTPAWEEVQKATLGDRYVEGAPDENLGRIAEWLFVAVKRMRERLAARASAQRAPGTPRELAVYQRAALYLLWDQYGPRLQSLIDADAVEAPLYGDFVKSHRFLLGHPGLAASDPAHLFPFFYQARRALHFPRLKLVGRSPLMEAARAAIWRANLGADLCAHVGGLYRSMDEIPVLITGETGTGKELAAACVAWSRYIPFDPERQRFSSKYTADYHARNLSEVPDDLVDAALFGHVRGAFTGASADSLGFLGLPRPFGLLFLDEIGELLAHLQVKLLRPLQVREYVPIGATAPRPLHGRHVFATHRDLEALCREGKFRADLLERINGVPIHMPSLRHMVAEAPEEMRGYVQAFVAAKIADPAGLEVWTERVMGAIRTTRRGHRWTRNVRELKNFTERYLLTEGQEATAPPRSQPRPESSRAPAPESVCVPSNEILGRLALEGRISLDELTRVFVTRELRRAKGNKAKVARKLGVNWRRVGRWVDPARLRRRSERPDGAPESR
jgi:DNA-binding NtrC family response regulator